MRLVTWSSAGVPARAGALIDGDTRIVDLAAAYEAGHGGAAPASLTSILGLIEGGADASAQARDMLVDPARSALVARDAAHLHAPLQPPPQLRDFSCFEQHLRNSFAAARRFKVRKADDPEAAYRALGTAEEDAVLDTFKRQPIYYKANRFSVVGADDDVIWPSYSRAMDFELEWACYIARPVKDVQVEDARSAIFGYTIYNDFSARDAQAWEMSGQLGPAKGKDFDTGNVMGPCLVTADEIPDPYDLTMIARVNGEEWGRGTTRDMGWTFEQVIAHVSRSETLHPGEALGSGTVGTGCGLEQMRYLKPDDVVELEVERIGILRSRLIRP
ncbi:fumarylacetoacetate hydrolase family protein [Sphingomonas sp. A2-49]|uniref:fumarylacetoacetate hydrolase family protein n=1 Tax=Sphingomonas sp. A2-49 TaxID=1391375 RepID=UPI0021D23591|nr:fumarylacetoacetate hydrolase family protein [Sphingomonas sp. A2-49]MCU6453126.1 fumarylacetoacetate hydrolase family protein [Sphingomonas sp. A2-49]